MNESRRHVEEEAWRRGHLRCGQPTDADAPPHGHGRIPKPLAGQTDIWQQLNELAAEQREREDTPTA
jgi:hypothetical protein